MRWSGFSTKLFSLFADCGSADDCLAKLPVRGLEQSTMWLLDIPQTHNGKRTMCKYITKN